MPADKQHLDVFGTLKQVFSPHAPHAQKDTRVMSGVSPTQLPLPKVPDAPGQQQKVPGKPPEKWISAGGIVIPPNDYEHLYICKVKGGYGGYDWIIPKGRVEKGESLASAALREVAEETGLQAKILPNGYLGSGVGTMSISHYFVMEQTGGDAAHHDKEMSEVRLVSWPEALKAFAHGHNSRDVKITMKAWDFVRKLKKKAGGEGTQ